MTRLPLRILLFLAMLVAACSADLRAPEKYKIALVADIRGQRGIFVINSDQTGGRLLTPDASVQLRASSWSPDGARLALSFGDSERSDIYIANLDGKQTRRITDSQGIKTKPVWSPDGKMIAYVSFIFQPGELVQNAYVIEPDGTNNRKIGDGNPYEVSWSVDGKSLLLQSVEGIALVSLDGDTTVNMKNKVIQTQDAVFTPDGKEVMFRSNHDGPWYLYAADLKGANVRRISGRLSASMFCLSPIRN